MNAPAKDLEAVSLFAPSVSGRPIRGDRRLHPPVEVVEACVARFAGLEGVSPVEVLGPSQRHRALRARRAAKAFLISAGWSLTGISAVWGCDRRALQYLKRRMEAAS